MASRNRALQNQALQNRYYVHCTIIHNVYTVYSRKGSSEEIGGRKWKWIHTHARTGHIHVVTKSANSSQ